MHATTTLTSLTRQGADRVMAAAEAYAAEHGYGVAICVADRSGTPILVHRVGDPMPASMAIAIGKAESTLRFARPTGALEDMINGGRAAFVGTAGGTPLRGGIPVTVDGAVVGAVGVSGLTPDKDEDVARAGAQALADPA